MEKKSNLTVNQRWTNYNIVDCPINTRDSAEEVKECTINACWRTFWPEVVNNRRISYMKNVVAEIATIAPGKETNKKLEKKKKQTSIKSFFVSSNTKH
jgi:hypothetical protein